MILLSSHFVFISFSPNIVQVTSSEAHTCPARPVGAPVGRENLDQPASTNAQVIEIRAENIYFIPFCFFRGDCRLEMKERRRKKQQLEKEEEDLRLLPSSGQAGQDTQVTVKGIRGQGDLNGGFFYISCG